MKSRANWTFVTSSTERKIQPQTLPIIAALCSHKNRTYSMPKKSCPFLCFELSMKIRKDFLGTYIMLGANISFFTGGPRFEFQGVPRNLHHRRVWFFSEVAGVTFVTLYSHNRLIIISRVPHMSKARNSPCCTIYVNHKR